MGNLLWLNKKVLFTFHKMMPSFLTRVPSREEDFFPLLTKHYCRRRCHYNCGAAMYAMLFLRSWEENKNFNVLFAPSTNYFLHFYCVYAARSLLTGRFAGE